MVSKSPNRHKFQRDNYMKRCEEKGEQPNSDYLDMFQKILEESDQKFNTEESRKDNLEYDLLSTDWILEKTRNSTVYAQNLYAALCNNEFTKRELWPLLTEKKYSCSWRYAGGIIADMRQEGDYIDWYCSGIRNEASKEEMESWSAEQLEKYNNEFSKYVGESTVTDEIQKDLYKLGWIVTTSYER